MSKHCLYLQTMQQLSLPTGVGICGVEHGSDPVVYMAQQRVCQLTAAICRRSLLAEPSLFCAVGAVIAPERKSLRQEPPQQPKGKHRQQQGEKHPSADECENGDHDTDEKRDTAPKGRFFFHFSCHLSKIIWKTKKEEPRMCPESLKTHHAVPLFHFAGIRLFRQAFPISVHDLHRRQRRLGSAGALLSCGALRCTGRLCLPSRQAELQPLVLFASTVSGTVHQLQKALNPDAGILVDLCIRQRQCSRSPCPDLKILSVTGIPAPDPFDQTEGHIGDLPVTHFQLKVIGHPTENMDFCHTTPFCREGNTYI